MIASTNHFYGYSGPWLTNRQGHLYYGPRLYEARSNALQVSTFQFLSRWSCGLS